MDKDDKIFKLRETILKADEELNDLLNTTEFNYFKMMGCDWYKITLKKYNEIMKTLTLVPIVFSDKLNNEYIEVYGDENMEHTLIKKIKR